MFFSLKIIFYLDKIILSDHSFCSISPQDLSKQLNIMLPFFNSQSKLHQINDTTQLSGFHTSPSETSHNFKNFPISSVFAKKFAEKRKSNSSSKRASHNEHHEQIQENQLSKIKHYSRILDSSTHQKLNLSPVHESTYLKQLVLIEESPSNDTKKQAKTTQTAIIYNYYASKNERKNKILTKAKEFGKSHFYRFLKQTAILQNNRHLHRLHMQSKNSHQLSHTNQKEALSKKDDAGPLIFAYQVLKDEKSLDIKPKMFQLPELTQINQLKKKLRLNTQPIAVDSRSSSMAKEGSSMEINRQSKMKKKEMVRCLTQINEKLKRNRTQIKEKGQLLFQNSQSNQVENLQSYLEKWKYKSHFGSLPNTICIPTPSNKQDEVSKPLSKQKNEKKPSKLSFLLEQNKNSKDNFRKSKMDKTHLLKNQILKNKISRTHSYNKKNLPTPSVIRLG